MTEAENVTRRVGDAGKSMITEGIVAILAAHILCVVGGFRQGSSQICFQLWRAFSSWMWT